MAVIVELSPVLTDATDAGFHHLNGIWNARTETEGQAKERGHTYTRPAEGPVTRAQVDALLATADALVLAPTVAGPTGMTQPTDGAAAGRALGALLLDRLSAERPELPVVLVSHFLVGHGVTHRNAKQNTAGLRVLEAHLRAGRNPWTILRPTWLATVHDDSYQIRLTQDQRADGLISTASVAAAVLTAVEHPEVATGRTAALFNLSIPDTGSTDLVAQFAGLTPDFEATHPRTTTPG